jgi:hypothetical protein
MLIVGVSSTLLGARLAMLVSAPVGVSAATALVVRNPGLLLPDAQAARAQSGGAVRAGREGDAIAAQPEVG